MRVLAQGQRWTAPRKREVVLRIFRGEPLDLLSRELGVELYRLEKWRDAALAGRDEAPKARGGDPLKAELDHAMQRLGKLTLENELLWARVRCPGPLAKGGRRNERHGLLCHHQTLRRQTGLPDLGAASLVLLCLQARR
ncbi:MAG: hypothetical protein NTY36_00010 [Deltaproteobacteria bacterium]|nr:hypothetical protein [Deltaproteobacteria bacterium]